MKRKDPDLEGIAAALVQLGEPNETLFWEELGRKKSVSRR